MGLFRDRFYANFMRWSLNRLGVFWMREFSLKIGSFVTFYYRFMGFLNDTWNLLCLEMHARRIRGFVGWWDAQLLLWDFHLKITKFSHFKINRKTGQLDQQTSTKKPLFHPLSRFPLSVLLLGIDKKWILKTWAFSRITFSWKKNWWNLVNLFFSVLFGFGGDFFVVWNLQFLWLYTF